MVWNSASLGSEILRKHNIAAYSICFSQSNFKFSIRGRINIFIIMFTLLTGRSLALYHGSTVHMIWLSKALQSPQYSLFFP